MALEIIKIIPVDMQNILIEDLEKFRCDLSDGLNTSLVAEFST
jgi:hypothetical protein